MSFGYSRSSDTLRAAWVRNVWLHTRERTNLFVWHEFRRGRDPDGGLPLDERGFLEADDVDDVPPVAERSSG